MAIFLCDWINFEIVTISLKAGLVDATQNQFNIIRRYAQLWKHEEIYHLHPKSYIKPLNLITVLLSTPLRNWFLDVITKANVKDLLPTTNRFNINIGDVRFVGQRPALWQPDSSINTFGSARRVPYPYLVFVGEEHLHCAFSIILGYLAISHDQDSDRIAIQNCCFQ